MRLDDGKTQAWLILSICGVLTVALLFVVFRLADGPLRAMVDDMARNARVGAIEGARIPRSAPPQSDVPLTIPRPSKEAVAIDAAHWITADDYPPSALRAGMEGVVRVTLDVDDTGRPVACHVLQGSGYPVLDRATCEVMMRRGRFNAGVVPGAKRRWKGRRVKWVIPD